MKRMVLVLVALVFFSVAAFAQKLTVSVMDLNVTEGLSGKEVVMLTDKLLNEFVTVGTYKVVERSKRDEILKEQGFQQSGACDQGACLVEAGQLLGVQKMVGGTIGKLGVVYAVELRVMDVKTGEIDMAFSRKYTGDVSNLLDAMKEAAFEFSGNRTQNISMASTEQNTDKGLTFLQKNKQGYKEYRNEKDGSVLIEIPASKFTMGSNDGENDENPVHTVYLDKYYIGKYEVTVNQFRKFVNSTGYKTDAEKAGGAYIYDDGVKKTDANWNNPYFIQADNSPVTYVSWNDAKTYCDWVGLRLPTEAEWEKAARGTDGRSYPWGNSWDGNKCNHGSSLSPYIDASDGYEKISPVGSFPSGVSPYGVYDMAGNVWEWCNDWYGDSYYSISPNTNPAGPSYGTTKVLRGGGWVFNADFCRSANRIHYGPVARVYHNGFRPAK